MNEFDVVNNEKQKRFEVRIGNRTAFTEYNVAGNNIVFSHTEVPREFEGQGIGKKLVETALDYARDNELKIIPLCPFVAAFIRRNPEYQPFVVGYKPKEQQ